MGEVRVGLWHQQTFILSDMGLISVNKICRLWRAVCYCVLLTHWTHWKCREGEGYYINLKYEAVLCSVGGIQKTSCRSLQSMYSNIHVYSHRGWIKRLVWSLFW